MKKTIVKKLIIAVVVLFISFMGFQIVQSYNTKNKYSNKSALCPSLAFKP